MSVHSIITDRVQASWDSIRRFSHMTTRTLYLTRFGVIRRVRMSDSDVEIGTYNRKSTLPRMVEDALEAWKEIESREHAK